MKELQCTSSLLMVRPADFHYNKEAAESNAFMEEVDPSKDTQANALQNFDAFVNKLRANGISVLVVNDTLEPETPDSIFPNNWVSFHADGRVILYPMEVENRRLERRMDILDEVRKNFVMNEIIDISHLEEQGIFLEGTGSIVLDRPHKKAYVCLSSRSHQGALDHWQNLFPEYEIITFEAFGNSGIPVYHTNVLMCVASDFVVICLESIPNKNQQQELLKAFQQTGKEVIEISFEQMGAFAGNMLQVENEASEKILVMSSQAFNSLKKVQIEAIERRTQILHSELGLIETIGGGSARCMLAEIHLPKRQ